MKGELFDTSVVLSECGEPLQVKVRISSRSKRVAILISGIRGPELVIPRRANRTEAIGFLKSKEPWIRARMLQRVANEEVNENEIPIFGQLHKIIHSTKNPKEVWHEDDIIHINAASKEGEQIKIKSYLKWIFKNELCKIVQEKSKITGIKYTEIKIKDLTSRWGSCGHRGDVTFSWRLVFAPIEVIEYVVIHELCHIVEFNHSKKFWTLVANYCPHYRISKRWLKENGIRLHSYLRW